MTEDRQKIPVFIELNDPDNPHYEFMEFANVVIDAADRLPKEHPDRIVLERLFVAFMIATRSVKQQARTAPASKSIGVHSARGALHAVIDFYTDKYAGDEKKALNFVAEVIRTRDRRTKWTPPHLKRCVLDWAAQQKDIRTSFAEGLLSVNIWRRAYEYDLNVDHADDRERHAILLINRYAQDADPDKDGLTS